MPDVVELGVDMRNAGAVESEIWQILHAIVMIYSKQVVFLVDLMIEVVMAVDLRC
jgi:hypothetical protein